MRRERMARKSSAVKKVLGDAHEVELIADHRAHQHDDDLFDMMLNLSLIILRQQLVLLRLVEQHVQRREFGVEMQFVARHAAGALPNDFVDEGVQQLNRQVVGEIEIGQVVANEAQALQPDALILFEQRVIQAFAGLRDGWRDP